MQVFLGVEIIFFTISSRGLSFGFVLQSVGNSGMLALVSAEQCLQSQAFSAPHSTSKESGSV